MRNSKKTISNVIRNAFSIALHTHACDFSVSNLLFPKKCILFLVFICFIMPHVMAEPVDPESVLQVAQEFVQKSPSAKKAPQKGKTTLYSDIVYTHKMPKSGRAAFYIVNVDDAFVLVSADDVAYQVLGYCFDKSFPIAGDGTVDLPAHIQGFFDDLAGQIEAAANARSPRVPSDKWTSAQKTASRRILTDLPESVGPLITTTWNQNQKYNVLCPEDVESPDGHAQAGCVATAMAQIVNYWKFPLGGRGMHSYNSNYGTHEVNFESSIYDFNIMPDALTAESTEEQIRNVAKLIYDCGVAVNMGYGPGESSAFDQEARAGLINFFRFSPDMSFAEKACFSNDDWNDMIRQNLAANQPVYYSGQGKGVHAFVCDGYKADDYFHFNFGWGGLADGWYLTGAVEPSSYNFSSSQSAIVGIVPDDDGNVIIGQMQGTSTFVVDEPLEFYHLMGHNVFEGAIYENGCSNTVSFIPKDEGKQLVVDIMEFEDQSVSIYDGQNSNTWIRDMSGGNNIELSPVVSTQNGITLNYSGKLSYAGFKLHVSQESEYRMVSNIVSSIENTTVHLEWTENGSATQWQIEYGVKGFKIGEGTVINTTTNSATIGDLNKFTEYDFYIRPVYGDSQYGPWNKATLQVEAPYWQDVVTSQPDGYFYNAEMNRVEVSSPEGLAWWAKNDCNEDLILTADIDMSGFKWKPICSNHDFLGQGHIISNVYIKEYNGDIGFFSRFSGLFDNVGLEEFNVNGFPDDGNVTGGLCGTLWGLDETVGTIKNCYMKNSRINGRDFTGGLIGANAYGTLINCFVNADVVGARWTGLLVGASDGIERNCYAAGNFQQNAYCYNGGIVAYSGEGEVTNCYSIETPMGVLGFTGSTVVNDTSTIIRSNAEWVLRTPAVFDDKTESDLLAALNNYLIQKNDSTLLMWTADLNNANDGLPVLGKRYFEVQCPNVSNMSVQNVKTGDTSAVVVDWQENGSASQWTIRYRRNDKKDSPYTYITTTQNPDTLQGIPLCYVYDFSVRAELNPEQVSGWCETQHVIIDLPYWTDVVTSEPAGYVEDNEGNVTISTTEGLAWLAVLVNGLHGYERSFFEGKTVKLTADIDLAGYRWNPIGDRLWFSGKFDGQGHSISNIYVNDAFSSKGLFGRVRYGSLLNVNLLGGFVGSIFSQAEGEDRAFPSSAIGGLVGFAERCPLITNCHSSVDVYGNRSIGSLCGSVEAYDDNCIISNCSASGSVTGVQACGGLIGEGYGNAEIRNCYASGDINTISGDIHSTIVNGMGGLIGEFSYCTVNNCYSTGTVNADRNTSRWIGNVIGTPYNEPHIHYLYGQDNVNEGLDLLGYPCEDMSYATLFQHDGTTNKLLTPVSIGETSYSDLLDALNAWVENQNNPDLKMWVLDNNTGYPVFAPCYCITYMIDGVVYKTRFVEPGIVLNAEEEPTKEGYTFSGWSEIPETMPAENVVVVGSFYLFGDVNIDNDVDVVDVVDIARFVIGTPAITFMEVLADINKDGAVNLGDAVVLVNNIAGEQNFTNARRTPGYFANNDILSLTEFQGSLSLSLENEHNYTAFQFDLFVPEDVEVTRIMLNAERKQGHQILYNKVEDGHYRVVALSTSNKSFNRNDGELLKIVLNGVTGCDVNVRNIYFFDADGNDYMFEDIKYAITTSLTPAFSKSKGDIFDLQGRKQTELQRGINVVGNKKTVVK